MTCDNGPEGDMFVNFMDYVDDRCMVMFTVGQVERMHAALDAARSSFSVEAKPQPDSTAGWLHTDLTLAAGAPEAAGDPFVASCPDGKLCVFYLGADHHIHALRVSGTTAVPSESYVETAGGPQALRFSRLFLVLPAQSRAQVESQALGGVWTASRASTAARAHQRCARPAPAIGCAGNREEQPRCGHTARRGAFRLPGRLVGVV